MTDHKQNLINTLKIMRDNSKSEREIFKARAYDKVIKNLELIKEPITSFKQIENIECAGKKIKLKLQEIINTGHLEAVDKIIKNNDNDIKTQLLQVYGIGPVKAKNLVEEFKIKTIEELREKSAINPKLLTKAQKIGLLTYEDLLERIPRNEMIKHSEILNLDKDQGEIVGSFRRNEKSSGDIDVMLNMNIKEFNEFTDRLIKNKYITHILAKGDKKILAICRINKNYKYRRLDLIRNTPEEYPYNKMYFTGPKEFNVAFRTHCLTLGYSLSEYGFTPKVDGLKSEKDIFNFVGLKYIEPKKRNGNCLQLL
jgi:DNA polymerase/3'-5' exonuclease PolX